MITTQVNHQFSLHFYTKKAFPLIAAMLDSSTSLISTSGIRFRLEKFQSFCSFFFMSFVIFTCTVSGLSASSPAISYADHCASFVPEATPTGGVFTRYPFLEPVTSHYTGGQQILGEDSQKSILFVATQNLFHTNIMETYKIQARLSFRSSNIYYLPYNATYHGRANHSQIARRYRPLVFFLDGFWSVSSKKLCMVGKARWFSKEGNPINLEVVLRLNFARNLTVMNSLVSGILESLASQDDSNYFDPISILGFSQVPELKYKYTLVSGDCEGAQVTPQSSRLGMESIYPCSIFTKQFRTYQLKYQSNCSSTQNCTPLGSNIGYLPSFMSLYAIQCSWKDKKLRFLVEFQDRRYTSYDQSFNPNITLVGEGTWNETKDHLCITACRILNSSDPLGNAQVGDCSIKMTLWFPAVQSIKKRNNIEGQIWTTKTADGIGYFEPINFQGFAYSWENYGSKYEFTETEKVRQSCAANKPTKRKGDRYPEGNSQNMRFDMSVKYKNMDWTGYTVPVFVGNELYSAYRPYTNLTQVQAAIPPVATSSTTSYDHQLNISYEISFFPNFSFPASGGISSLNLSTGQNGGVLIFAEGVYDGETGRLCMLGCRDLHSFGKNLTDDSMDCEILVRFQIPRTDEENRGFVKGSIESLREKGDVLYFEHLDILSLSYTETAARKSMWRMDLEIIMVLISNTFACVFIVRQLIHMKRQPEIVPFISVFMMLILTLGHMVPLVLNFEALFWNTRNQHNISPGSGDGWIEVNDVIVRIVTMVALLLQFRLLQLAWTAKLGNENGNGKNLWTPELKTLFITLPIYILGGTVAALVSWKNNKYNSASRQSLWGDLRSYAGLALDGFLFPQIILNILQTPGGPALSRSFYIGTTFVRLLPHAYDLFRGPNNISHQFDRFYIYANPRADFYSATWDVVIACGGIVFAVTIFLQQRWGSVYERQNGDYEKVSIASTELVDQSAS